MEKLIPSFDYCKKCSSKDIRALQDFNNRLVLLISKIADVLEINGDLTDKINKVEKWIQTENRKRKMMSIQKKTS